MSLALWAFFVFVLLLPVSVAVASTETCIEYQAVDIPGERGSVVCVHALATDPGGNVAFRVQYRTRGVNDTPHIASALVYLPASDTAVPAVVYAHRTTGIAPECGPSVNWPLADKGFDAVVPGVNEIVSAGAALVVPDYIGLGAVPAGKTAPPHPYLHVEATANAVIDSVLAARSLSASRHHHPTGVQLGELSGRVVLAGHSQGAHAVLSAASALLGGRLVCQALPFDVAGLVLSGTAARIDRLVPLQTSVEGAVLTAYIAHSLQAIEPSLDLAGFVSDEFRGIVDDIVGTCFVTEAHAEAQSIHLNSIDLLVDPLTRAPGRDTFGRQFAGGGIAADWHAALLSLTPPVVYSDDLQQLSIPVLLVQGGLDNLVPPLLTSTAVLTPLCRLLGERLSILTVPVADHEGSFAVAGGEVLRFMATVLKNESYTPSTQYDPANKTSAIIGLKCIDL